MSEHNEPDAGQPWYGYGPQPGYGSAAGSGQSYVQYGYPSVPETDLRAIVALVLSIASFALCPFVAAIAALVVAGAAKRDILASGGAKAGLGLVTVARLISWANLVLSVVAAILIAVLLVAVGHARVI
jgi:hypothetical protein